MRKITWIPLVILIAGLCLAGAGWAAGGHSIKNVGFYWDNGLHLSGVNNKGELGKLVKIDETYKASDVNDIDINVDYLDNVSIKAGEAGSDITVKGANYEEYGRFTVNMTDNKLSVGSKFHDDGKRYIFNFGVFPDAENCYLEITVPKGTKLNALTAKIEASKIDISDLDCDTATIDNNYGDIKLSAIKASDIKIQADAGQVNANAITVAKFFEIENNYGNIKLDGVDAGDIKISADAGYVSVSSIKAKGLIQIDNDYGDVNGNDIQAADMNIDLDAGQMSFSRTATNSATIRNNYGDIKFDYFTLNGLCDIKSDAGKVSIGLTNSEEEVGYNLAAEGGTISVGGRNHKSGDNVSQSVPGEKSHINIDNGFGNIKLEFGK